MYGLQVFADVRYGRKAFLAQRAFIGGVPGMDIHVLTEPFLTGEFFLTIRAAEQLSLVNLEVLQEPTPQRIHLATMLARMEHGLVVLPHMPYHEIFFAVFLAAHGTRELGLGVHIEMVVAGARVLEQETALVAALPRVLLVHYLVDYERFGRVEPAIMVKLWCRRLFAT